MKKILIYAAMAAASLTAFSCQGVVQEPETDNDVLVLTLDSGDMETKSADTSFETAIDHFDFFFFSDAEGTAPIPGMHGRAEGSSKVLNTQEGAEFAALRSVTSYVYILANYPSALDHSADWTLAQLLALEVDSKIVTEKKTETNPITGDVEETGEVTYASNLVMDSWQEVGGNDVYTVELTPAKIQEQRNVTVGLSRLAAKITVEITVVPSVTVGGNVWKSHPEVLTAYYVNALNNKATVLATPVKRSALTDETGYEYLTYPKAYPMTPAPAADVYKYTTDPVYTYPQEWSSDDNGEPYFKLQMPWVNDNGDGALSMGSANIYYKATVPQPGTDGKWTIERNKWYKVSLTLSMLNTVEDYGELEFDCTVVPWAESGWKGGSGLSSARFFDVPTREFTLYSEAGLKIPFSSSSAVTAYFKEITYTHYGAANKTDATFSYPYRFAYGNETDTDVLLPTTDSDGNAVIAKGRDLNRYTLVIDGKFVDFNHDLTNVFTERKIVVVIKNQEGRSQEVTIFQHPAIEIEKILARNAFVNGHFSRAYEDVCDADGNLLGRRYGPTISYDVGRYRFCSGERNETYSGQVGVDLTSQGLGNVYSDWSPSVKAGQMFLTKITVSAFNDQNNKYKMRDNGSTDREMSYIIGDPREEAGEQYTASSQSGWSRTNTTNFWLPDYLASDSIHRTWNEGTSNWDYTTHTAEYAQWEEPLKVLIASQKTSARNVIAPRFLVSSAMNGMHGGVYFDESVRRAATYQENGYPAGRWRLPTEAEIAFIVARQRDGSIPELFVFGSTKYWCASRSYVALGSEGATTGINIYPAGSNVGFNRFVYDLWYWGDEPVDEPNCYHANMHEH